MYRDNLTFMTTWPRQEDITTLLPILICQIKHQPRVAQMWAGGRHLLLVGVERAVASAVGSNKSQSVGACRGARRPRCHRCSMVPLPVALLSLAVLLSLLLVSGILGVQITSLDVPAEVRNGSGPAVLDCVYSLRQSELAPDSGLVVKWFWNNSPAPVYQWIPGQRPQDLGVLKGRLDLRYRASEHPATMHRALYINTPTPKLSGEYKCAVSTFWDEDFMIKRMIVYAGEVKTKKLFLTLNLGTNGLKVTRTTNKIGKTGCLQRPYNRDADLDPEEVRTLHFNDHYQYESSTDPESEPEPAPAMLDLPMGDAPEIQDNYPEASTVALAGSIARL
ncbi:uncharacterized protein LOC124354616 [Homalodisca vitripennis]|uniref:uncharacterized protein LOC124354616 n=1 Tax=Homalodisca vitripennis TaxID=197043 RepID=UPI001EEC6086|nr:uncharacterized protein LOC124354616 [Homalodisca vitripennis]